MLSRVAMTGLPWHKSVSFAGTIVMETGYLSCRRGEGDVHEFATGSVVRVMKFASSVVGRATVDWLASKIAE
jgi:hypothetical protein